MGMFSSQKFEFVRGEVDDQHFTAGFEHAAGLANNGGRIGSVVQHLM